MTNKEINKFLEEFRKELDSLFMHPELKDWIPILVEDLLIKHINNKTKE